MHYICLYKGSLYLIFTFLLTITALDSMAAGNLLKGRVTDAANQPLMGVVVSIPDLKNGAVTDSNGEYVINNLPQGSYVVQVRLISYAPLAVKVAINGETVRDFALAESAIESAEIVVTGQSKATQIRRSPVPIVAINAEYLKERQSTNIIDAITNVPGITAVTTGPNISKPFIRGLGYNRVLTLYDGMRQEGQQWGDEHGIEIDQYNIDRVEVVKGPASLIYGSDALAGVVNLIPVAPAAEGKIQGNVQAEYQGNNGLMGGSAMLTGNKKGFYWLGRLSGKQATNYQNSIDGRVYGTGYREIDANASVGVNRKWGYSHLSMNMFNDLQGVPDGSRDSASRKFTRQIDEADTVREIVPDGDLSSYKLPVLHQHVQHYRIFSSNNFNLGEGRLALGLGYSRSIRQEFSHPQYADIAGLYLQLNTLTYDVKYYLPELKGWNAVIGINGMYQVNDASKGTEFIIPSYRQFDLGPFAMITKNFDKLDISGGVRFDSRTFNNEALYSRIDPATGFEQYAGTDTTGTEKHFDKYSNTFSGITGSIGATYNFTHRLSVKANVARGFRAPNIAEISSNGIHPGTGFYQLGNVDFKPEFSLQEDIGIDYSSEHFSLGVAVFNNDIANYIYNQKLLTAGGADSMIVPGYPTLAFQAGHAQLYGGELNVDIHPHPLDWLHFENSISYVNAVNKGVNSQPVGDSARYLPNIPPLHGISELRGNFKKTGKYLRNSFVKVQLEYYARQDHAYLAYGTETPTPAYQLVNVSLGSDIAGRKGQTLFNISLFVNNLFDVAYQNHQNRMKYFEDYPNDPRGRTGIYNMGRNVGVHVTVPF